MTYFKQNRPNKVTTQHSIDYLCEKTAAILNESSFDYPKHFEEMKNAVFQTLMSGLGQELCVKLQQPIRKHLQKMHQNLTSSFADEHKIADDKLFHSLFNQWFEFSDRLVVVRQVFFNLESVLENSIGEESLVIFAWRIYRSILIDSIPMIVDIIETVTANYKEEQKVFVVDDTETHNQTDEQNDQKKSVPRRSLFSDDSLYDFLRCVDTATLGLSVSLCCRRFANFADSVLRRRAHSDCALMFYSGQNHLLHTQSDLSSAFAVRLFDSTNANVKGRGFRRHISLNGMTLYQVIDNWFCNPIEQKSIEFSDFEVPEWITGMRFLYLLDGITPPVLSFLRSVLPLLENCRLKFEMTSFWSMLHSSGQLLTFLSVFNLLIFSLQLTYDELFFYSMNRPNPYFYKLPLWAILQSVFFPNCYDLSLPLGLLSSREIGIDIAIWLHNKKNCTDREKGPRRIVLSECPNEMNTMGMHFGYGIKAMIGLIRERFAEDLERHHFIVESSSELVNAWEERFLLNGNGECLLISPNRIVRCFNGNEHAKFEQFHKHLNNDKAENGKEYTATIQIGTIDSVRWLKEVMAKVPRK